MNFDAVTENLQRRGFSVRVFSQPQEAVEYLKGEVQNTTVGFGGSITLQEMGLYEALQEKNRVYWHWRATAESPAPELLKAAQGAEVYFSSANALAQTGELINIDGQCNRVAGTLYGHKRVYFILGRNKLAPTPEEAMHRARNIAAPLNARRLQKKTPCAAGVLRCHDCRSPERICRALTVLWEKPMGTDCQVILIDRDLGY